MYRKVKKPNKREELRKNVSSRLLEYSKNDNSNNSSEDKVDINGLLSKIACDTKAINENTKSKVTIAKMLYAVLITIALSGLGYVVVGIFKGFSADILN